MANAFYNPGIYWGVVTSQSLGKSKNKGTPEIQIRFSIQGIVDPADPEGPLIESGSPQERTVYIYVTDKTAEYARKDLESLGYEGVGFSPVDSDHPNHVSLVGVEHAFRCELDTYEGNQKEQWRVHRGGREVRPLEDKEKRSLDAMWGGPAEKKAPKKKTTRKPAEAPDANAAMQEAANDDVPF